MNSRTVSVPAKLVTGGEWIYLKASTTYTGGWYMYINGAPRMSVTYSDIAQSWFAHANGSERLAVSLEVPSREVEGIRQAMHIAETMYLTGAI
jgi:hypothetical protein